VRTCCDPNSHSGNSILHLHRPLVNVQTIDLRFAKFCSYLHDLEARLKAYESKDDSVQDILISTSD
jgi:hypothetical protein